MFEVRKRIYLLADSSHNPLSAVAKPMEAWSKIIVVSGGNANRDNPDAPLYGVWKRICFSPILHSILLVRPLIARAMTLADPMESFT